MRARPGLTDLAGTYAATLLMQASTLVVGVILARALGPEARGTLAAALIWPTMVAALALLGTNNRIALEAAEAEGAGEGPALARRVVGFAFACAGGALAVGYLAMPWLVPAQQPAVLELSRLFLLFAPASILLALLKGMDLGEGRLRRFNVTSCVLNLGHLALVVVVWLAGAREPTPFLLCLLLANYAALAFRILRAGPRALAPRLDLAWARGLVVRAAPYLATAIAVLAHAQADRVFLLWYLDAAALGLYTVALSSASVHMGLGQSVARLIFSRATRADAGEAMVDIARLFRLRPRSPPTRPANPSCSVSASRPRSVRRCCWWPAAPAAGSRGCSTRGCAGAPIRSRGWWGTCSRRACSSRCSPSGSSRRRCSGSRRRTASPRLPFSCG